MKRIMIAVLALLFISNASTYALDIDINDTIDPVSLDMLIKQGLVDEKDIDMYLIDRAVDKEVVKDISPATLLENEDTKEERIDIFKIENINQIGQDSIMIKFSQKLSKDAYIKNNYTIEDDSGKLVFKYSDFEIREVISDDKSLVLKLKTRKFEKDVDYRLLAKNSLRSFYMLTIDNEYASDYTFTIKEDMINNQVISYNAYEDGYIDVEFKYEITDEMMKSKNNFNISYNDSKFMKFSKSVELLEDDDGVARTMRIMFSEFQTKYDYRLTLEKINVNNNEYKFPGGSALSNYFNVEDINVIDNYTIDVTLDTKIRFEGVKELVKISGALALDNFEIYDDNHIILHLKKDAGLDYLSQYTLELINFTSIDNRKLPNISYVFATEDDKIQTEYVDVEPLEAKWIGEHFIKISFSKAVDLYGHVNSYVKVKDESDNYVKITESYQSSPKTLVIKVSAAGMGDKYMIYIKNVPEKGNQFRSDEESIVVSN